MYKLSNITINETDPSLRTSFQAESNASIQITLQVTELVFLVLWIRVGRK
jgi:hypothetical protein